MHKTVSVSIGASLFVIEETAYARLDAYLKAIRRHFAKSDDAEEIVSDIEDRIAEELAEVVTARKKVILMKDVDDVIASMGTIEDFQAFDAGAERGHGQKTDDRFGGEPFSWKRIRLYRDADNQIIGGVAAGIANYFGIDPLIVRIAFALSLLAGGFGVVLYILLWILLPEARTTAQKVEMTGGRVTLQSIQEKIDEHLPPEHRKSAVRKILAVPVAIVAGVANAIGKAARVVGPLLGRLVGLALLLGTSFAIAAATFMTFAILINPSSPYIGLPLREILGGSSFVILVASAYMLALMPLLFILLVAASLVSLRRVLTWPAAGGLLAAWFVALVVAGVTGFSVGPRADTAYQQWRSEHAVTVTEPMHTTDFPAFDGIAVSNDLLARIRIGTGLSITTTSSAIASDMFSAGVANGTLTLGHQNSRGQCIFFCERVRPEMDIVVPSLVYLRASDISRVELSANNTKADLRLTASDASRIYADVDATAVTAELADVSRIELRGSGSALTATAKDASRLDAFLYAVKTATVNLSDVSRINVTASDSVMGAASDASRVSYRGQPATVDVKTSDIARVSRDDTDADAWDEREWE